MAGDIDVAETNPLVEKWFSEIPEGCRTADYCPNGRSKRSHEAHHDRSRATTSAISRVAYACRVWSRATLRWMSLQVF